MNMIRSGVGWAALGLLVAGTGALVVWKKGAMGRDERLGSVLLPAADLEKVHRISLVSGDKKLELSRDAQGAWTLPEDRDFPADAAKISGLLEGASQARVERRVATTLGEGKEFSLNPGTTVKCALEGGGTREFVVGGTDAAGGQFLRLPPGDVVYAISRSLSVPVDSEEWTYKVVLEVPRQEVLQVDIAQGQNFKELYSYQRSKVEESFTLKPADGAVKAASVDALLGGLEHLRYGKRWNVGQAEVEAALKNPVRRVTIVLVGGLRLTLVSGAALKDSGDVFPMEIRAELPPGQAPGEKEAKILARIQEQAQKFRFGFAGYLGKPL